MNFSYSKKPPSFFWAVGVIAFLWYAFGVYNFLMHAFLTSEALSQLSSADQVFHDNLPAWYISAFALAVFTGLIGSIALLIRKRWAYIIFVISFLDVGIQQFYVLTEINPRDIFMSLSSLVIAVFLVWFSKRAVSKGWLK